MLQLKRVQIYKLDRNRIVHWDVGANPFPQLGFEGGPTSVIPDLDWDRVVVFCCSVPEAVMREAPPGVKIFTIEYATTSSLPGVIWVVHVELLVHVVGGLVQHHLVGHGYCLEEDELFDG